MVTTGHSPDNRALALIYVTALILFLQLVSAQRLLPLLTIPEKELKLRSENGTYNKSVTVRCSQGPSNLNSLGSVKALRISHRGEDPDAEDEMVVEATDTQKKAELKGYAARISNYEVKGTLSSSNLVTEIVFGIKAGTADCDDAGRYRCTMVYTTKSDDTEKTDVTDGYIGILPYAFEVTQTPNETIKVGEEYLFSCTAIVGSVNTDPEAAGSKDSTLEWVYSPRDTAVSDQYTKLEQTLLKTVQRGNFEDVRCSQRMSVSMKLKVEENRDSKRDYHCVAARYKAEKVIYLGGSSNKISIPSYEKPEEQKIGIGGYVGIGLGALATLSGIIFGIIWCIRRRKKKKAREMEVERRKSMIDDRRKSISTIVERRKSMIQTEEVADEASVVEEEESVAESSVAESSVAESSVAESSVAESTAAETSAAPSTSEA